MSVDEQAQIDTVHDLIHQAKQLMQQNQIARAETTILELLNEDASNVEAVYVLAVCRRYLQKFKQAMDTLAKLKAS